MKKVFLFAVLVLCGALTFETWAASATRSTSKPFARFVIPVQQQPEFKGVETNVVAFSTWDTNQLETVVSITNTVPAVNTNAVTYCDFVLFAIDQETGSEVLRFGSIGQGE